MYLSKVEISIANSNHYSRIRGDKTYELSNHLGNVLATITDRKLGFSNNTSNNIASHYQAEVTSATDYYPFGSPMSKRSVFDYKSKYGFNGKEKDDEISGGGNHIDFGARGYDSRRGQWWSVDPLADKYPFASPYNFVLNTPIQAVDPDGKVVIFINGQHTGDGGSRKYWRKDGVNFDQKVMKRTGDYKARYYDGASGGWINTIQNSVINGNNLIPGNRRRAGFQMAKLHAAEIINNLEEGESIKIVSHSYGGAYSKGFAKGLLDYAKKNKIEINIEYEVDFAPFQPEFQEAVEGVGVTTQISHIYDNVSNPPIPHRWGIITVLQRSNNEIEGADAYFGSNSAKHFGVLVPVISV